MFKQKRIPPAPLANPEDYSLGVADFAEIQERVTYTLSDENKARLALVKRAGPEAAARAEAYIGKNVTGADRMRRYLEIAKVYDSRVFLDEAEARRGSGASLRDTRTTSASGQTPTSNTGVTAKNQNADDWQTAEHVTLVVGSGKNRKVLEVPKRHGHNGDAAFVDWLHITIGKETCDQYADFLVSDEDRVLVLSYRLERLFGFGVTIKHKSGRNFYAESYGMGNDKESWGYVCIGGQEETILIGLTGTGLAAAKPGWEGRLVNWLQVEVDRPKLTRVDLAYDDYEGKSWNVEKAESEYHAGAFQCYHGTEPDAERIGTDWIKLEKQEREWARIVEEARAAGVEPEEPASFSKWKRRGRTFAVGRRASGKYCRTYEKGQQLGDPCSFWCRVEVEFKAVERVLPFDMFLQPGKYLAGAYPCLQWINETQDRVLTHKKNLEITLQSSLDFVKKQAGQHINVLVEALGFEGFLAKVRREGIPKRFKVADLTSAPNPMRISYRLDGLESHELNALVDLHISGHAVPGAIFGHRSESLTFRPA